MVFVESFKYRLDLSIKSLFHINFSSFKDMRILLYKNNLIIFNLPSSLSNRDRRNKVCANNYIVHESSECYVLLFTATFENEFENRTRNIADEYKFSCDSQFPHFSFVSFSYPLLNDFPTAQYVYI